MHRSERMPWLGVKQLQCRDAVRGRVKWVMRSFREKTSLRVLKAAEQLDPCGMFTVAGPTTDRIEDVGGVGAAIGIKPIFFPQPTSILARCSQHVPFDNGGNRFDKRPQVNHQAPRKTGLRFSRSWPSKRYRSSKCGLHARQSRRSRMASILLGRTATVVF